MTESVQSSRVNAPKLLFKGIYEFGLDDKRRVQVPSKWRPAEWNGEFHYVLFYWLEENLKVPCISVMTQEGFDQMLARFEARSPFDARIEAFRRNLGVNSDDAPLDKAGRICLPERFIKRGGLEGADKVVLTGVIDRFQIWRPEVYNSRIAESDILISSEVKKEI